MIDLSPLKDYLITLDDSIIKFATNEIANIGLEKYMEYNFNQLDCTRVWKNGMRPMQTIDYTYSYILTEFIYLVGICRDIEEQDKWLIKLLKRHTDNLEYEKVNPPIVYKSKKNKTKIKEKDNIKEEKSKSFNKISNAERKIAAKVAKINMLSIKIKPV